MSTDPIFLNEAIRFIKNELKAFYTPDEVQQLIFIIFEHLTDLTKVDIISGNNRIIPASKLEQVSRMVYLLKKKMPIEYIVGKTKFYYLDLKVSPDVLIPRPETEELVEWIIKTNTSSSPKILDIGTGNGCIAISLAKNIPGTVMDAIEISPNAICIAKANAQQNGVKINFFNDNILCPDLTEKYQVYDIIVSNPPYVMEKERERMDKNVLDYEPDKAIFVSNENPLVFYNAIADFSLQQLCDDGVLYFEINEALSVEVTDLLNRKGYNNVVVRKDINEKFRFIKAKLH